MVREMSIGAFVRDNPVYDWILMSFCHKECVEKLKRFTVEVSPENLDKNDNSVKKRFVQKVNIWFELGIPADNLAEMYDIKLVEGIRQTVGPGEVMYEH
jgi:hypothetical protein